MLLGNKKDCISSFRQVPTRDGEALADMLSVSGKGRRREGREVEEGGGGRVEGGWRRDVEVGEEQSHTVSSSLGEVVCMRSIAHTQCFDVH